MKLFVSKFYQTLVFNVATICAIVVGLSQFLIRAYTDNNGNEKIRKVSQTVLQFVNTNTERLLAQFAEPEATPVPVRKVAHKTAKRS
jgi:hypothetical protein